MPRELKEVYFQGTDLAGQIAPGLTLTCIGRTRVFPEYRIGPARKDHYTLLVVRKGRGGMQTQDGTFQFSQGHVIAQLRDHTYQWWTDPIHLLEHYWLTIDGDSAGTILRSLGIDAKACIIERPTVPAHELAACEQLLQLFKEKPPGYSWKATSLFFEICHSISVTRTGRKPVGTPTVDPVEEARSLMDTAYAELGTISEVAEHVALSPATLARRFRERFGVSPHRYLTKRRIGHARALLSSGVPVKESAIAAGFQDPNYFSRVFRKHVGVPPSRIG